MSEIVGVPGQLFWWASPAMVSKNDLPPPPSCPPPPPPPPPPQTCMAPLEMLNMLVYHLQQANEWERPWYSCSGLSPRSDIKIMLPPPSQSMQGPFGDAEHAGTPSDTGQGEVQDRGRPWAAVLVCHPPGNNISQYPPPSSPPQSMHGPFKDAEACRACAGVPPPQKPHKPANPPPPPPPPLKACRMLYIQRVVERLRGCAKVGASSKIVIDQGQFYCVSRSNRMPIQGQP